MSKKKILSAIAFTIGFALLGINIYGLFIPLKNQDIYHEQKDESEKNTTFTYKETIDQINSASRQDAKEYVRNVNKIINQSITHYWEDEGIRKYNLTIPPYENYILYALSYAYPDYKKYEFCQYKKALERGIGLCSQYAIAITDFLNTKGIETKVIGLDGHVVATTNVGENEWWILDPASDVVIPYSIKEIEASPSIVKPYYQNKLDKKVNLTEQLIVEIYGVKGNVIYPAGSSGYLDCNWKKILIERASYFLIWIIPVLLFLPYVFIKFGKTRK